MAHLSRDLGIAPTKGNGVPYGSDAYVATRRLLNRDGASLPQPQPDTSIMKLTAHLILVSAQPIPNLSPMLDEATKPQKVVMLVSDDMREQGKALEKLYKEQLRLCVEWHNVADPWNAQAISEQVDQLIRPYPQDAIALNATGGTKLMSIAAYEAFYTANRPVFYVHPERDCLLWLDSDLPPRDLANRLTIKSYLTAYGAASVDPQPHGVPPAVQNLTKDLINGIDIYQPALSILNALAMQARETLKVNMESRYRDYQQLQELIERFAQAGQCQLKGSELGFPNEEARFMVNGGWLEQHCYSICRKLANRLQIQDIACSVNLTRLQGKQSVPNEIDLAMLAENRLYVLECKTKRFSEHDKKHGESADVLYKLNTLRNLYGGSQARAMLVSFNKLGKSTRERAKDLRIEICSHTELKRLEQKLQEWLTTKR